MGWLSLNKKKGDVISCILLNVALEKVISDFEVETKGTVCNKSTQTLAYKGDTATVGRSVDALEETVRKLMKASQVMGLTINKQKTKYMAVKK
jgi:hypothetical protein